MDTIELRWEPGRDSPRNEDAQAPREAAAPPAPRETRIVRRTMSAAFSVILVTAALFGFLIANAEGRGSRRALLIVSQAIVVAMIGASALFIQRQQKSLDAAAARARAEQDLQNRLRFLQTILDTVPMPVFIRSPGGVLLGCNSAFERHAGKPREEVVGRSLPELEEAAQAERIAASDRDLLHNGGVQTYEETVPGTSGGTRHLVITKSVFADPGGVAGGIVGTIQDITARKRIQDEILRLKEFNETIVRNLAEGIVVTDQGDRFAFVNPAAAAMLGYEAEELIGLECQSVLPIDERDVVRQADERRRRGISDHYEIDLRRRDGSRVHVVVGGGPLFREGRFAGTIAVFTDITAQQRMAEQIRELSLHDELTGLHNRRGLFELSPMQFSLADRFEKRLVVLYVDVDDLKLVNDARGHDEGDRVLLETARLLRHGFRQSDLIARIGGDEFLVLALETRPSSGEELRTRLLEKVEERNAERDARDGHELRLSVGIVHYEPHSASSLEQLIAEADQRMYEDKRTRKAAAQLSIRA